jgi:hypothetical protein
MVTGRFSWQRIWQTLWCCLLLSTAFSVQAASSLTARVDKNPLMMGEELVLLLELDEKVPANAVDFTPLSAHFQFGPPAVSQSMQIINGQSSQSTRWQLSLFANQPGTVQIPAFAVAGVRSEPITVEILPASQQGKGSAELFIESTLSSSKLHVQQMGYYEVKIFYSGDLQRGSLSQPELAQVTIEQIGKDIEGSELVNGQRYQTITRRYSLVPQQSGDYQLTAPWFQGEMIDRSSSRYDYFAKTKAVSAQGQTLSFQVKPIETGFEGQWLVSELVTLQEEWSADPTQLVQGEPITRTITLTAMDLADHQLPDLQINLPAGIKSYDEKPQSKKAERKGRMVAQKVFTSALIANQQGQLLLPAVRLPWWNSIKGEIDYAELPARELQVIANPQQQAQANMTPVTAVGAAEPATVAAGPVNPWHWNYLSTALFLLWLLTVTAFAVWYFWQRRTRIGAGTAASGPVAASDVKFNANRFKTACQQHDAELVSTFLLRWGRETFAADIRQLSQLLPLLPAGELKLQLEKLAYQQYQREAVAWQGDALYHAWSEFIPAKSMAVSALPPLYPA